jgi:hypothetical protein
MGNRPCICYRDNKSRCGYCNRKYCGKCLLLKKGNDKHSCQSKCCRTQIEHGTDMHYCRCTNCHKFSTGLIRYNDSYKCLECRVNNWRYCRYCSKKYSALFYDPRPDTCRDCHKRITSTKTYPADLVLGHTI